MTPEPTRSPERQGLDFGPLGYGAANIGNLYREVAEDEAHAVLEACWDAGIRYFDTAPHYGLGLSERRLGAFLQTKPRDEFILSTKVGRLLRPNPEGAGQLDMANNFAVPADVKRVWDFTPDGIRASVEESLERLGLDRVDVLFLHDPEKYDVDLAVSSALPALVGLRDEGVARSIGVGSMSVPALLAGLRSNVLDLLMVAGRFTLAEQPALTEVVPEAEAGGVGIVNASVFNSGLLASVSPGAGARYEYGEVPPEVLERTRRIARVCAEFDVELPAAALQYTLRDRAVRTVVVGSSRAEQMRQNLARMGENVPEELWRTLTDEGLIPQGRERCDANVTGNPLTF